MNGTVTISIEVELGWGVHDLRTYDHLSQDGETERTYLGKLLDRCVETDLPITFDVVGHLLLDGCSGDHEGPYPPGWFDEDPGTDPGTDGRFYAPDVVDRIATSPVAHELCSHTFSHAVATGRTETVAADLARAQRLHETVFGERPVSFVPPRHTPPPPDLLTDLGIEIVRVGLSTGDSSPVNRFRELLSGPVPTWDDRMVDGVVETYCTTYPSLVSPAIVQGQRARTHPVFRVLPLPVRQRLHRRRLTQTLDRVAADGGHVNLWCHLYDLSNPQQWAPLSAFLGDLARRRDAGDVDVLTLAARNDHHRPRLAEVTT